MPREMLCRLVAWTLVAWTVIAAGAGLPMHAADSARAAEPRDWKDEAGKFGVTAAFVRRNDFGVVLREASGAERHVLWHQLSRGDQEYVDAAVAAEPKLRVTCPQAKAYLPIIAEARGRKGTETAMTTGFVFRTRGDEAAIFALHEIEDRLVSRDVKPSDIRYRTTTPGADGSREVTLQKSPANSRGNPLLLFGARSELPEPIPPENRLHADVGDILYMIYYQNYNSRDPAKFERKVEPVVVRRKYRLADGEAAGFEIEFAAERRLTEGIVVADDGSTFARLKFPMRRAAPDRLELLQDRPFRYFDCEGHKAEWTTKSSLFGFNVIGHRAEETPTGWKIELLAAVCEPFEKATEMKALIEPEKLTGDYRTLFEIDEAGAWKNASPRGKLLELKKAATFDPALVYYGPHKQPQADFSYWSATTTIEMPKVSSRSITFDLTARDETGRVRAGRSAAIIDLDSRLGGTTAVRESMRFGPDLPLLKPKPAGTK
jgi:hypothetical protein